MHVLLTTLRLPQLIDNALAPASRGWTHQRDGRPDGETLRVLVLAERPGLVAGIQRACSVAEVDLVVDVAWETGVSNRVESVLRSCDVVLVDHGQPVSSRLRAIEVIRDVNAGAAIIVTGIPERAGWRREQLIFTYLEARVSGYLSDSQLEADLSSVIDVVLRGGTWIEPGMAGRLVERVAALRRDREMLRPCAEVTDRDIKFTPRQQEVLKLISLDLSNQEIADRLFVSVGTVKNHVHRIFELLGFSSREQAALYFQRSRNTSLPADDVDLPASST